MQGKVKIYASDYPSKLYSSNPVGYANIKDGITTYITNGNLNRKYFKLVFDDKYAQIVGARYIKLDSVQNMRDIGGYKTQKGDKSIRWGKVFRSGNMASLADKDKVKLSYLEIKTIIDLAGDEEGEATNPKDFPYSNVISIPVEVKGYMQLVDKLKNQEVMKGDGALFLQDLYLHFVEDKEEFGKALKLFADKDNYPIAINSSFGKDRVGFLTILLLSVLDIPEETIIKDYLDSNEYINILPLAPEVHKLNNDTQEAITVMLHANEALVDMVFEQIDKKYGSVDKYLSNELGLTDKERESIKDILLE